MGNNWIERGRQVLEVEEEGLRSVRDHLGPSFAAAVGRLAAGGGRVIVTGIGKSGLVGRKIAATFSSTGTPAFFLHPVEGAHGDLGAVQPGDVVLAISYSGRSRELTAILPALRGLGTTIIALTARPDSPLAALADIVLDAAVPREACPMNLAPTSSSTAALALGDALAVCLMECKNFTPADFQRFHPGGALGERLRLSVAELMRTGDIPVVPASALLDQALTVLNAGGLGAVVILGADGAVEGILTDGDVRRWLCRGSADLRTPVAAVMTKNPRLARPENSVAEIMDIMEQKTITVLPVVDEGRRLAGIVHLHDLLGKGQIAFAP
ncbi:MAG: KpsF/GutQ family sugar-phosphate isomerase [Desulfovibrio sp.]|jgi:arabinose-5-phosphate isomerase|nr:KpsF/GutQ family sugar-phosphate isomerase [Desulfovibrio sp.]